MREIDGPRSSNNQILRWIKMAKKINLRLHDYDVNGKRTKNTKSQVVTENSTLSKILLSKVILKPDQKTKKETLVGEEKICFFLNGNATVYMNDEIFTVQPKDVLLLPEGTTYYIENYTNNIDLHYNTVSTKLG